MWRGLKALGAGVVRDGVYVLPNDPKFHTPLQVQANEVVAAGGTAQLLEIPAPNREFAALFDRTPHYAGLMKEIQSASRNLHKLSKANLARALDKLRHDLEGIANLDFFPRAAQEHARSALDAFIVSANQILAPGEPHAAAGQIKKLKIADYQNRIWATRKRPWIDRLASAWFIHRFIDPAARIKWLDEPTDCPSKALGFDFDGATFSHIGGKVTFEVLAASFGLDTDPSLQKVGALVHYLDVGGIPVSEAAGLEAIISGIRHHHKNDDTFLAEAEKIFDLLYTAQVQSSMD